MLEGGRDAVCEPYNAIAGGPRHRHVRILNYEEITEHRCGGWTMGLVNVAKVNQSLVLKYGVRAELDPFSGSGCASIALLDELIATAWVVSREG